MEDGKGSAVMVGYEQSREMVIPASLPPDTSPCIALDSLEDCHVQI